MLAIADIATEDTCAAFHNTGMLARQTENKGCIVRTYDSRSVSVQGSHCSVTAPFAEARDRAIFRG